MQRAGVFLLTAAVLLGLLLSWNGLAGVDLPERQEATKHTVKKDKPESKSVPVKIVSVEWPKQAEAKPKPKLIKKIPPKAQVKVAEQPAPLEKSSSPVQAGRGQGTGSSGGLQVVGMFACGVDFYLEVMRGYGARTVIFEQQKGRFFELTPQGRSLPLDKLDRSYSQVSRRITEDYPGSSRILHNMEALYGAGDYEILLLLPRELADRMQGLIERRLPAAEGNRAWTVFVTYRRAGGHLQVDVDRVVANGVVTTIGTGFPL